MATNRWWKILFIALIVRPVVLFALGLNVIGRPNLPRNGPAVVAANHNSHLDTLVLLSLYPLKDVHKVRPVAAADYFLRNRFLAWLSLQVIGIIPLDRTGGTSREQLFAQCHQALDDGQILLIFPEGSRGDPERLSPIKKGLYHLVGQRTDTAVTPVVMLGLGRALPRGEAMLVPFNCDVAIGESLPPAENADAFVAALSNIFSQLLATCPTRVALDDE